MTRKGTTGEIRVWWAPTVDLVSTPTIEEINGGVNLTPYMARGGLSTPRQGQTIDTSDASNRQNTSAPGSKGGEQITFTGLRDNTYVDDDAWTTLYEDASGYLIVRRFGGSTAIAAVSQRVEVYPVTVISRAPADIADNQAQQFTATLSVTRAADLDAVVVHGS